MKGRIRSGPISDEAAAGIEFLKWIVAEGANRDLTPDEVRDALDQAARRRRVDPEVVKARLWAVIGSIPRTTIRQVD
jgi:hypothetical protein